MIIEEEVFRARSKACKLARFKVKRETSKLWNRKTDNLTIVATQQGDNVIISWEMLDLNIKKK